MGIGSTSSFFLKTKVNDRAVFVDNQRFGRFFFPPSLVRHPAPLQFDAAKGTNTLRIFVMGESAAMGDPDPFFGFGRILEVLLRERHPNLKIEMINTGITAINSHTVRAIAKDCASREGDFWIVYMGNNEVVGPYGPGTVFNQNSMPPLWFIRAQLALKMTRLGQCTQRIAAPLFHSAAAEGTWNGMEMFIQNKVSADDPRVAKVHDYFRRNLEDIVQWGATHGACVLLCPPAHNIRNCGPFASVHNSHLSAEDLSKWNQWYEQGITASLTNEALGLDFLNKAEALDSRHADLAFRQGIIHLNLKHYDQARHYLEHARDQDALRFRPDREINAIYHQLAAAHAAENVRLVDTEAAVAQASPHGLPGSEMLYDHVHFTFAGNFVLAMAMAATIDNNLPPRLKAISQNTLPWLSQEECTQRIAYTPFDQYQIAEIMLERMKHAPFTQQSDWKRNTEQLQVELNTLKPQTKPWSLKKAAAIHHQAAEHAPDDWNLIASHARLLQYAGNTTNAIAQWRETLRLAPYHPQAHCNLGMLLADGENYEEAQFHLQTALSLCPESPQALNSLGSMLTKNQQFKQALGYYQKAVELAPDSVSSLLNAARTLEQLGQHKAAIRFFNRILDLDPANAEARRHLNIVGDTR